MDLELVGLLDLVELVLEVSDGTLLGRVGGGVDLLQMGALLSVGLGH